MVYNNCTQMHNLFTDCLFAQCGNSNNP
jgi:hypothetical protein